MLVDDDFLDSPRSEHVAPQSSLITGVRLTQDSIKTHVMFVVRAFSPLPLFNKQKGGEL